MRRHAAAMKIIADIDPTERVLLLTYVVVGTPAVDEAVVEAERQGLSLPANRRRSLTPA
jgi:hypothetical protein